MSSKAESPGESKVCGLEVEPARACYPYATRIVYRDTGALRHVNFDRLTAICPS